MSKAHARIAAHDLLADDQEEVSSIRQIAPFHLDPGVEVDPTALDHRLDLELDVDIEAHRLDRGFDDPTPVYARPYIMISGRRCDFPRGHYLGTRFATGIIESGTWEQEIRAAGASDRMVERCRQYLDRHAL